MKSQGCVVVVLVALLLCAAVEAETFRVTKLEDDDGECTVDDCALREAVLAANATYGSDIVELLEGVHVLTINGTGDESQSMTGDLDIRDHLAILGDPSGGSVIEARVDDRVIEILFSTVSFDDVTITGGHRMGPGTSPVGGCVRMLRSRVTFRNSWITGCYCDFTGGGVGAEGTAVTYIDTTLSGNESRAAGGAIYHVGVDPQDSITLINSTVSGNRAGGAGGAMYRTADGNALISNSTIAFNEAPSGPSLFLDFPTRSTWIQNSIIEGQCRGLFPRSRGGNLGGPDPENHCFQFSDLETDRAAADLGLGPLADNGGPTLTHALGSRSPAIDGGDPEYCEPDDQRGMPRPQGEGCDSGALELLPGSAIDVPVAGPWGLLILAVLLGLAGSRTLYRRRSG